MERQPFHFHAGLYREAFLLASSGSYQVTGPSRRFTETGWPASSGSHEVTGLCGHFLFANPHFAKCAPQLRRQRLQASRSSDAAHGEATFATPGTRQRRHSEPRSPHQAAASTAASMYSPPCSSAQRCQFCSTRKPLGQSQGFLCIQAALRCQSSRRPSSSSCFQYHPSTPAHRWRYLLRCPEIGSCSHLLTLPAVSGCYG